MALAAQIEGLGAEPTLVIGASHGIGDIPDHLQTIDLGLHSDGMMAGIRDSEAAFEDLPAAARARIDTWNPDGGARAIRAAYSSARTGPPTAPLIRPGAFWRTRRLSTPSGTPRELPEPRAAFFSSIPLP